MMNLELALHVVVLEGQQALDIVQPSVHFGGHISAEDFKMDGGETYVVLGSNFPIINGFSCRGDIHDVRSHQNCGQSHER